MTDTLAPIYPYPSLTVSLTVQKYGSKWLGILRGLKDDIDLTFNGLFNFGASNGEYQFASSAEDVAIFWTSQGQMRKFWRNKFYFANADKCHDESQLEKESEAYANAQMGLLESAQEVFQQYKKESAEISFFGSGTTSAEKPDEDMKDAILSRAFADTKEVDTSNVD